MSERMDKLLRARYRGLVYLAVILSGLLYLMRSMVHCHIVLSL